MTRKTIVIKLGGSALDDQATLRELGILIAGLRAFGHRIVVVHGGGPAINRALTEKGITWTFVHGQRRTTPEMMDVIENTLSEEVSSKIIEGLRSHYISAVRLSGAKHKILRCEIADTELVRVGKVTEVAVGAILAVLATGDVPVIAPLGFDIDGALNVNADWAATSIAQALKADELLFLTDQDGVLNAEKQPLERACPEDLEAMIEDGTISGGMRTKVLAMISAVKSGVGAVRVLNATRSGLMLTPNSPGTTLTASAYAS